MSRNSENQDIPENGSEESIVEYVCDNCDTYCYEILHPTELPSHCAYENALQQYKIMLKKLHTDLNDRDMLISELRDQHIKMQTYCRNCLMQVKHLKIRYKTALQELEHFKRHYETQIQQKADTPMTSNQALESLLKAEVQRWNRESMEIHNQMQNMNYDIQQLIQTVKNGSNTPSETVGHNQLDSIEKLVASQTAILSVLVSKVEENVKAIKEMNRCPGGGYGRSTKNIETTEKNSQETQTEPLNEITNSTEIDEVEKSDYENEKQPSETEFEGSVTSDNLETIDNMHENVSSIKIAEAVTPLNQGIPPRKSSQSTDADETEVNSNKTEPINIEKEEIYSKEVQDEQISSDEPEGTKSKSSNEGSKCVLPDCCKYEEPRGETLSVKLSDQVDTSTGHETSERKDMVNESGDKIVVTDTKSNSKEAISIKSEETGSEEPVVEQVASVTEKKNSEISFSPNASMKSDTEELNDIQRPENYSGESQDEQTDLKPLVNEVPGVISSSAPYDQAGHKLNNEAAEIPLDNYHENISINSKEKISQKPNVTDRSKLPECCQPIGEKMPENSGSHEVFPNVDEKLSQKPTSQIGRSKLPECCQPNGEKMKEKSDSHEVFPNVDETDPISFNTTEIPDPHEDVNTETEQKFSFDNEIEQEEIPVQHIDPLQQMPKVKSMESSESIDRKNEIPENEPLMPPFLEQFLSTVTIEIENIKEIMEKRDELLKDLKGDLQGNQTFISHKNSELISKIQSTLKDLPNWICSHSVFNEIQKRLSEVEQVMKKMQSIINELKGQFDSIELNEKNAIPTTEDVNSKNEAEVQILNELLDKMKTLEKYMCGYSSPSEDEKQIKDQLMKKCICKKKKMNETNKK